MGLFLCIFVAVFGAFIGAMVGIAAHLILRRKSDSI
jgi:uncharacterized membrane protein SpoIIM required for sporulation